MQSSSNNTSTAMLRNTTNEDDEEEQLLKPVTTNGQQQQQQQLVNTTNTIDSIGNDDDKDESTGNGNSLLIAFLLMLLFQLGNRIFSKLSTYPMYNYPLFMNLLSTFIYLPICFAYIIPVVYYSKTIITQDQLDIPKYKFMVMGTFDSMANIMSSFAVNYIPSAGLIVLVQQSAIPISMAISRFLLQARYTNAQYIGALIVCAGIFVVLAPTLFASTPHTTIEHESTTAAPNQLLWIIVLVLSCVPMCLSSVYKEKALGEVDIDVVYLNGWVSVFQAIVSIPLSFPSASISGLSYAEIFPNLVNGSKCLVGINSVLVATANHRIDTCEMAPVYVWVYLFFNIIYNVLIVVILKIGSANIMWMASTVIVPLSNVVFSLSFIPNHKPMKPFDILGLFIIMSGLVVYRFMAQVIALFKRITGRTTPEEIAEEKAARKIAANTERKSQKYVGLNQIESLQTLLDTRVWKAQMKSLFRTPQQIRGNFLAKLGIPPSPRLMHLPRDANGNLRGSSSSLKLSSNRVNYSAIPEGQ